MDLTIDPELLELIPRCCKDDDERLEKSLLNEGGCHHAVVVWKGTNVVVDGHRRKAACEKLGLSYPVEELEFANKDAVKRWMLEEQLGRRNLNAHQRAMCLAALAKLESDRIQSSGATEEDNQIAREHPEEATENTITAKRARVAPRTVRRATHYTAAFRSLPEDIQRRIEDQSLPGRKEAVIELASLSEDQQREAVKSVDDGEFGSLTECLLGADPEKPTHKPIAPSGSVAAMFSDAFRAVGTAKKILDPLARIKPNQNYKIIMGLLAKVGEKLEEWKKA